MGLNPPYSCPYFPAVATGAAATGLPAGFAAVTGFVGLTGSATGGVTGVTTGGVTGVATGGVTGSGAVARDLQQTSQRLFFAEHVGQSVNVLLAVVAPQLPHLPMAWANCLLAQFAQSPAFAEADSNTVVNANSMVVVPYVKNRFMSYLVLLGFRFKCGFRSAS